MTTNNGRANGSSSGHTLHASGNGIGETSCPHDHVVQFYEQDEFLFGVVADFLASGLVAGNPAIVIATPSHREGFTQALGANGTDVEGLVARGQLTLLDARETLDSFMIGGMPDARIFGQRVGAAIERCMAGSKNNGSTIVYAYGEMVDLLWKDDKPQAAIRLEELWNDLARIHRFRLLCAYTMANFYRENHVEHFEHICRTHTHVVPTESATKTDTTDPLREIARVQQRALALENEVKKRKELEAALREALEERRRSEAFLQEIVKSSDDCIKVLDLEGKILFLSEGGERALGCEAGSILSARWADFWKGEERDSALRALEAAREGRTSGFEGFLPTERGSRTPNWWDIRVSPMVDHEGKPQRILVVSRNVSERKHVEDERVARLAEKESAEQALKDADRRKDEFLAMLAHELRNPLAPITTALHLVRTRAGDREDLARPLAVMTRQTQHMSKLVDDLLEVSRITRGKIRLERETFDASIAVNRAVELSHPLIDSKKHSLQVSMPHEPLWIDADLTRMAQVLGNLLNNAAKYTDEAGHISVTVERDGREVLFRVRDDGIGIPKELMPRLFELFTQADTSLDRSQGGLGIGLTLVRGLVELHGGSVQARSEGPGKGSEFVVRVPLAEKPKPKDRTGTFERLRAAVCCRIVVVDDNLDAAESLAEFLADAGHEVKVAYDGQSALEAVRTHKPNVVFLDIGLPRLDGYEVARQLRREHGNGITLVALTGYGQEEDRRRTKEAGFDHHLVKPVHLDALSKLLARTSVKKLSDPSSR